MTPPTPPRVSPIPWRTGEAENRADGPGLIRGADGKPLAYLFILEGPDLNTSARNAELVVKAVNAHDVLVEALVALLTADGHIVTCLGAEDFSCQTRCARARAALKLARG